jgi:hypothetical protein
MKWPGEGKFAGIWKKGKVKNQCKAFSYNVQNDMTTKTQNYTR